MATGRGGSARESLEGERRERCRARCRQIGTWMRLSAGAKPTTVFSLFAVRSRGPAGHLSEIPRQETNQRDQRAVRAGDLAGSVIGHTRDLAAESRDGTATRSVLCQGRGRCWSGSAERDAVTGAKPMVGSRLWSRERARLPCQCSPRRSAAARTRCRTLSLRCCRRRADPWPMDLSAAAPS